MTKNGERIKKSQIVILILTGIVALIMVIPIIFTFMSAFKTNGEIVKNPLALPSSINFDNFRALFEKTDFIGAIFNSVFLTVVSEILIVIIVPMASYALERRPSKYGKLIYTYFLAGMMIPFHLYMFSLFRSMKTFGLYGNKGGPIVCYVAGSVAFGTLLFCSFLKGIPIEVEEAAKIDGCNPFQTFWKVVFPLLGPCTASMVILNGLGIWNDFLMPYLVLPSGKVKTITVEVFGFVGQYTNRWDIIFAGTICSIVPALLIFISLQKYFVKGITAGAAKG